MEFNNGEYTVYGLMLLRVVISTSGFESCAVGEQFSQLFDKMVHDTGKESGGSPVFSVAMCPGAMCSNPPQVQERESEIRAEAKRSCSVWPLPFNERP